MPPVFSCFGVPCLIRGAYVKDPIMVSHLAEGLSHVRRRRWRRPCRFASHLPEWLKAVEGLG